MKYVMLIADETGFWESLSEEKHHETFGRIGQWWGELSQRAQSAIKRPLPDAVLRAPLDHLLKLFSYLGGITRGRCR